MLWPRGSAKVCIIIWNQGTTLWDLRTASSIYDLLHACFLVGKWQLWRDTQMLSVKKVEITWLGKPWKQTQIAGFFLLFCLERILIKIQKRPHQMHVLCFICETSWDLGPTLLVQSVSWGGVWMGDRNGLWTQIKKCSLKLVDFNVLYKLTRSQNLISLNILH